MNTYEFLVSVIGLLVVASLGALMAYRNAKSPRERSFVFKAVGLQAVLVFGFLSSHFYFQWSQPLLVLALVIAICIPIMFWIGRRVRRIRAQQDDTNAQPRGVALSGARGDRKRKVPNLDLLAGVNSAQSKQPDRKSTRLNS